MPFEVDLSCMVDLLLGWLIVLSVGHECELWLNGAS